MTGVMATVLIFLAVLSFLIAIHEGGHLISAKLSGVWVHEYAIGFGPSLVSKKIRETTYSIKPIPFGGYVRMAGEDVGEEADQDEEVPEGRKFYSQTPFKKMFISVSGPAMNIIAAVLIMILVVGAVGSPRISIYGFMENSPSEGQLKLGDQIIGLEGKKIISSNQIDTLLPEDDPRPVKVTVLRNGEKLEFSVKPKYYEDPEKYMLGVKLGTAMTNEVAGIQEDTVLSRTGFEPGDRITVINGNPVNDGASIVSVLGELERGEQVGFTIDRDGQSVNLTVSPENPEELLRGFSLKTIRDPVGPVRAINQGLRQVKNILILTYQGIRLIISGKIAAGEAVTGPVGIANLLGQSARKGVYSLFLMVSLISLNLGLINLVPFPALDGSRIGYATYELIRGKPIPPEKEGLINSIGFLILIGLMIFITYRDIIKFFN